MIDGLDRYFTIDNAHSTRSSRLQEAGRVDSNFWPSGGRAFQSAEAGNTVLTTFRFCLAAYARIGQSPKIWSTNEGP